MKLIFFNVDNLVKLNILNFKFLPFHFKFFFFSILVTEIQIKLL